MMRNKSYAGLDYFRIIAALLIIAIHTSPLLSYSKMADFVLTSIIARIAVPFFFMLSGFFLISTYNYNCNKLKSFLKNVLFISLPILNTLDTHEYLLSSLFLCNINFSNLFYRHICNV